ncbi:MAG: hypothetical protein NTX82_02760 [Candidatus Parcubacteria bacterium]|nr:hypothetical protein [Candidatus Parcubacteria bacterium]
MIIKYSDKFDSIFYAVLCANITGYFLVPKTQPPGLFEEEEFIDIDRTNWNQIIDEHNRKFGDIKWFNNNKHFFKFRDEISLALRFWQPFKYKVVTDVIKTSIKYGLSYFDKNDSLEVKYFQDIIKQVKNEIALGTGYINLIPANKNNDKFLLGEYNEESCVGDLVLKNLQQKYFGYNFILRTPKFVYLAYKEKIFSWNVNMFNPELSLAKLLEQVCQENIIHTAGEDKDNKIGLNFIAAQNLAFG